MSIPSKYNKLTVLFDIFIVLVSEIRPKLVII